MSDGPRRPPPLPPRLRPYQPPPGSPPLPPPRPPLATPKPGESTSQALKDHITTMALGILEEQVQARIVHYKADLETNPELDAITAEVVASLKQLQATVGASEPQAPVDRDAVRESHERLLASLLQRLFRADGPTLLMEKRLKAIHKKLARLFFESELHEKTRGQDGATKVIQHGEQAIFYLLVRYENRLKNELSHFEFASDDVKERAFDLLARIAREMQEAFLARRSSELKRIVTVFHGVLVDFLCKQLAPVAGELAREVIGQAGTWEGRAVAYKVQSSAFSRFRGAFERRLMVRLVGFAEDELVGRLADTAGAAREEAIAFITDPRIFSMICGELSEGAYEFLCNEGFLDMPPDWRAATMPAPVG